MHNGNEYFELFTCCPHVAGNDSVLVSFSKINRVTFILAPFLFKNADHEPIYNAMTVSHLNKYTPLHKAKIKTIVVPPNTKGHFMKLY